MTNHATQYRISLMHGHEAFELLRSLYHLEEVLCRFTTAEKSSALSTTGDHSLMIIGGMTNSLRRDWKWPTTMTLQFEDKRPVDIAVHALKLRLKIIEELGPCLDDRKDESVTTCQRLIERFESPTQPSPYS